MVSQTAVDIWVNKVSHQFNVAPQQTLAVLEQVQLHIKAGQFVAFLGPSGCGKSTLLRLIAGLEPPTQGTLKAAEHVIDGPDPSRVVVFQDPTLFSWRTVYENVALGLQAQGVYKQRKHLIAEVLKRVGLADFAQAYPHQLSGGMAQRAALARALIHDPAVLILDEPLGKLDSLTRLSMQTELLTLWQRSQFTTLLVTHDVEEAIFLAQRIIVLSDRPAKVVADIAVPLPYPRKRGDPELARLREQALGLLGLDDSW